MVCGNGFLMSRSTTNAAYISGVNERAYMRLLAGLVRPGQTAYNVGANVGYLALWLSHRFGGRVRVVGFEPEPGTAHMMADNITLNPDLPVSLEPVGLGNFDGVATLYSSGAGDGAAALAPRDAPGVAVQLVRLDAYQATAGTKPDWLIVDVEGFAGDVMAGGLETIRECRPAVAAEIHSPEERAAISDVLLPFGYIAAHELDGIWGNHVVWLVP